MRVATLSFVLTTLAAASASAGDEPRLTDEDKADLAWLDGLGCPQLADKPFVEVRHGKWLCVRGFVVEDDGARLRLLSPGFQEWSFERSAPGTPDDQRLTQAPVRLSDAFDAWLVGGPAPSRPAEEEPLEGWPHPDEPSQRTQTLVCAWALSHGPHPPDAAWMHAVLAHARTMSTDRWVPDDPKKPFHARLADDFAAAELHRAESALCGVWEGDLVRPRDRAGQLDAFRAVVKRFPGSSSEAEARKFADVLERMAREDAEHAKTAKPLETLAGDERRRELVFRLRGQTTNGLGGPDGAPGAITDGPYVELVKDGLAAVPALLDALADDSFTRVGGDGQAGMTPYVRRVQELALDALQAIAGRTFLAPPEAKWGDESGVPWALACRPTVEAWYAEVKAGGEVASLVRLVEAGDWAGVEAAKTLLLKDAARVPAALVRGLSVPDQHPSTRAEFLTLLAKTPGDVGLDLLRKEAASGGTWTRLESAALLAGVGDASAPDALLALWRERRDGHGPPTWVADHSTGRDRIDELRMIVAPLVALKRADLVRDLAEDLSKRADIPRRAVVEALAAARSAATGDFAAAIDAALADETADRAERLDWIDEEKPVLGFPLRVGDVAAAALAATRGLDAPVLADAFAARDAKCAAIAAAFGRAAPAVPTPSAPAVDPAALKERLDAFARTTWDGQADLAARLRDLEALGPGAVPALVEFLGRADAWHAAMLKPVVAKLAFVVRGVRTMPAGADVPVELAAKLDALVGKPLTAVAFADAALAMIRSTQGASLDADRGADGAGVVVTLSLFDPGEGGWSIDFHAIRAGRGVVGGGGGGWSNSPSGDRDELSRLVEATLCAGPSERAWIHVAVVRRPANE